MSEVLRNVTAATALIIADCSLLDKLSTVHSTVQKRRACS